MILQERYSISYEINDCIKFKNDYTEVIEKLNNISDDEYIKLSNNMNKFCDDLKIKNIEKMKTLINNIIDKN